MIENSLSTEKSECKWKHLMKLKWQYQAQTSS